jgi:hypothetical protein
VTATDPSPSNGLVYRAVHWQRLALLASQLFWLLADMPQYSCLGNFGNFTTIRIYVVMFYVRISWSLVPGRLLRTFRRNIMLPFSRHVTTS